MDRQDLINGILEIIRAQGSVDVKIGDVTWTVQDNYDEMEDSDFYDFENEEMKDPGEPISFYQGEMYIEESQVPLKVLEKIYKEWVRGE